MSRTFRIPIPTKSQIVFPARCVNCGEPEQAKSVLAINRVLRKGKKTVRIAEKFLAPHCERCARSTKAVFLSGLIPFAVGLLLVGGLTLAAVTLGAMKWGLDNYGLPNNANSLVLGAFIGLIGGLIGGLVFELVARILLLPFFGMALMRAPLLSAQLLSDSDYVAGLSAKTDAQTAGLLLIFSNDQIAREFEALNSGLIG
jgi:hypothetical protein